MTLVLGIEIVRVTVFVFGLAIFFANATTLLLVLNTNSKAAHYVSASTASICLRIRLIVVFEFLLFECQVSPTNYYDIQ